ncbi:MAG: hypothetical protein ABIN01_22185, partial [Ferruginibacter sp.]
MRINRWIVSLCFFINFAAAIAGPAKGLTGMPECSSTNFIVFNGGSQANYKTDQQPPNSRQTNISIFNDSLPKTRDVTVMIPFEYKQSSLNFQSTFRSIDSVVEVLFEDTSITLSIDGFSYFDEGSDSICYWLSFNRALAVRDYVVGRGIDSLRILSSKGRGSHRSIQRK